MNVFAYENGRPVPTLEAATYAILRDDAPITGPLSLKEIKNEWIKLGEFAGIKDIDYIVATTSLTFNNSTYKLCKI